MLLFCLCLCGHSSARREAWVLGTAGHLDKLPTSLDQQGACCPGQIRLNEREREVKGLSALPHYKLIPTLAARHIRKDQLGMCFPAISTTERTQANRERVKNPEKNDPGWRRGHYHAFASLLSRHGVRLINGDRACKVITGLLLRLSGA